MDPKLEKKDKNKKLKTALKVVISLALILYIVFRKVDKQQLIENFKLMDWRFIPVIILCLIANYVVSSIRWKALLVQKKAQGVSTWYLISLYFIGAFFNNFLPTSVGGDVYKVYRVSKKVDDAAIGLASVFMERFTGIIMLGLIALLSMTKTLGFGVLMLVLWFVLGLYIGLFLLKLLGKKIKFLGRVYDSLIIYKFYPKVLGFAFITSIIVQLASIFGQYFTFRALGVTLPVFYSLLAFPIIILAGFFIPSINGLGVQDALYISMFAVVGVPATTAISASIIYHLARLGISLVGGVLYALGKDA